MCISTQNRYSLATPLIETESRNTQVNPEIKNMVVMASDGSQPHPPALRLGVAAHQPSRRHNTQSYWSPHFMTQERLMFSNPTPSEPHLSSSATMSVCVANEFDRTSRIFALSKSF